MSTNKRNIWLFFLTMMIFKTTHTGTLDNQNGEYENKSRESRHILNISRTEPPNRYPGPPKPVENKRINATMLSMSFENCMRKYDKRFRPHFADKATDVELELHVLSFNRIDESAMEYGIDFYFAQFWNDPRLIEHDFDFDPKYSYINLIGKDVERIWLPDVVFINSKFSRFHDVTINNRFLNINFTDGRVVYHARITTTAQCRMDLRDYPFDVQTCFLAIESYGHDKQEITFRWFDEEKSNCTSEKCKQIFVYDKEMSNFDVVEAVKSKNKTTYHAGHFSTATAKFTFKRRSKYFALQVYLPCVLIVMVTWASFWITPSAVPARSAICVTTMLTLITMLGIVNANMPKVSYIKALDLYLLVAFIFVLLSLFEYILVLNFNGKISSVFKKGKKRPQSPEKKIPILFSGGQTRSVGESKWYHKESTQNGQSQYLLNGHSNGLNGTNHQLRHRGEPTVIEMEQNNNKHPECRSGGPPKRLNTGTSHAKCDVISRFLFPLGFICFNVGYWVTYVTQQKEFQPMK